MYFCKKQLLNFDEKHIKEIFGKGFAQNNI